MLGTLNALLAARDGGAGAFVFASSGAPLGAAEPPGHEGLAPRPLSPYGASKLAGEGLCSAFSGSYGISATALRFTNVYGPFSYHKGSVVALYLKRIMDGRSLTVYGDGEQTRDFLYVDDLCDAVVAAIARRPSGGLYQLGHRRGDVGQRARRRSSRSFWATSRSRSSTSPSVPARSGVRTPTSPAPVASSATRRTPRSPTA